MIYTTHFGEIGPVGDGVLIRFLKLGVTPSERQVLDSAALMRFFAD